MSKLYEMTLTVGGERVNGEYSEFRAREVGLGVSSNNRHVYEVFGDAEAVWLGIRKRVNEDFVGTLFLEDSIDGYLNDRGELALLGSNFDGDEYEGSLDFAN